VPKEKMREVKKNSYNKEDKENIENRLKRKEITRI
jgi:hypothetical protein